MAITSSMNDNNTTTESTRVSGQRAEAMAARFLEERGMNIVTRNFHCRGGEIDLVCRDGKVLVFVEVRLRRNAAYGGAGASITAAKQRRIVLAARHYLAASGKNDWACRFDCILIEGKDMQWIRDAFSAD